MEEETSPPPPPEPLPTYWGFICGSCRILYKDLFRRRMTDTKIFLVSAVMAYVLPFPTLYGVVALNYLMLLAMRIHRFHSIYFCPL